MTKNSRFWQYPPFFPQAEFAPGCNRNQPRYHIVTLWNKYGRFLCVDLRNEPEFELLTNTIFPKNSGDHHFRKPLAPLHIKTDLSLDIFCFGDEWRFGLIRPVGFHPGSILGNN